MPARLENRIAALEGPYGEDAHLSLEEVEARIDEILARLGTTLTAEIARYGSEKAIVTALRSGRWDLDHKLEENHEHD